MKDVGSVAFAGLFYAVGLGVLGYALWSARRSAQAAGWPVARGVIQSCTLDRSSDADGNPTYEVKVSYAYQVGGRPYVGDRLAFGYTSGAYAAHEQICDKLRSATTVDVRYNPSHPADSVLSYGVHRSIRFMFAFGVTWLAFVIGFTVIWWVATRPDDVLLRNLVVR